ncbi:MAG: hypothetical protein ACP5KN_07530 [Armatimonadota bacterium]
MAAALLMVAALAPALAETRVIEAGRGLDIALDNGVRLRLEADRGGLLGLTEVQAAGVMLRSPELAAHPVVKLQDAGPHTGCELAGVERDDHAVVLHCRLLRGDGGPDELTWRFEPRSETIGGGRWVGLAWRYQVSSPDARLDIIRDISSWEIGGDIEGAFVQPGPPGPMTGPWRSTPTWTFATTPWFRFQASGQGMLYDTWESVSPVISWVERRARSPLLLTFDDIQQELRREASTPFRRVMFRAGSVPDGLRRVDEYTRIYDHLERRVRDEFGIQDPVYRPVCKAPQREDESFRERIEDLDMVRELGFRGMWMCTFESRHTAARKIPRTNAGVWSLVPAELLGGTPALAELAEAARERGVSIYTWAPANKIVIESPVHQEHPRWHLKLPEGQQPRLAGSTNLHSEYYDYAIEHYRRLHEATGIDSAWFDTFNLAATRVQVRENGTRFFQTRRAFEMVADTQRAGIATVQLEGEGPAGQDALTRGYYLQGEPLHYNWAPYINMARPAEINYYYRSIANRSFPIMPVRYVLWTYEYKALDQFPGLREQVRRANLDWAAVHDLMVRRRLIAAPDDPWEDVGVEWTKPGDTARALFAYGEFDYRLPEGAEVTDVTAGRRLESGEALRTACCHTYRIERAG